MQVDEPIFLEEVLDIIKDTREVKTLFLITTRSDYVKKEIINNVEDVKELTIPLIGPSTDFKPNITQNDHSLLSKLNKLDEDERNKIIEMSGGAYGRLENILSLGEKSVVFGKQFEMIKKIFQEDGAIDKELDKKIEVLLLSFFIFPEGVSLKWIDHIFPDPFFDYYKYLDAWKEKGLICQGKEGYILNNVFECSKRDYVSEFDNSRVKKNIAQVVDNLLKEDFPEKYELRSANAKLLSNNKHEEYHFLFLLRSNQAGNEEGKYYSLLKILTKDSSLMDDIERAEILNHLEKEKNEYMPLLIYAEYAYFRIQILLNYSYDRRQEIRPKIELQLYRLVQTFDDLVENNEAELAIKIGVLLAPEIINYLTLDDIPEANRIYQYVTVSIHKFKKQNYSYYKYYDVVNKFISTSILDYKKASFNLQSVINDINEPNAQKEFNYEELLPMAFNNWLGLTLYLDQATMKAAITLYQEKRLIIDNFKKKSYKIKNNLLLAEIFLQDKISQVSCQYLTDNNFLENYHVSAINYAGLLAYSGHLKDAEEILQKVLHEEKSDNFYVFFCEYNLCIIEILSNKYDAEKIVSKLKCLEVPSLFYGKSVYTIFLKRIKMLEEIVVSEKDLSLEKLDELFRRKSHENAPIFRYVWGFSDYQYWN